MEYLMKKAIKTLIQGGLNLYIHVIVKYSLPYGQTVL